jgi:hypothetical protein
MLGIILGVVFLAAGMLGFFLTSDTAFVGTTGPRLLDLFEVNPLQNLLHIASGVVLLLAALVGIRISRVLNGLVGAAYLLLGAVGILISGGNNPLNIVALDGADNVLNFAFAVVLLVVALGADRTSPSVAAA